MTDTPWTGDIVSLVEAFRSGERHPTEELNAVCHIDADAAHEAAASADTNLPFGGVPLAVKELSPARCGWGSNGAKRSSTSRPW
jgi:Asp-tRNA(Asn)/Glu-tRNA(Gln) amidotransferase A subunit family amidase